MAKHLVIVESPAKAKTVNRYLGNNYVVKASMGHIRDLPKTKLGVDVEQDFKPDYRIIKERSDTVADLRKAAKASESVLLAADPDREGEAICWHLARILEKYNTNIFRMRFHEITRAAVEEAARNLIELDENKINAQQTRRILDRLVGYRISPLLWRKVGKGLSAGRVQSIALRLICEREKQVKAFVPEEFWTITALLAAGEPPEFKAGLVKIEDRKVKLGKGPEAEKIVSELKQLPFVLHDVKVRKKLRNPPPPYITSTLQQDSFRLSRYPVRKTMSLAQKLYEGMEIGDRGLVGLITYMRTDSVRISAEALQGSRAFIQKNYSPAHCPAKPRVYKNKKKTQDAHEAIRPTSFDLPPEAVKPYLKPEELRVYTMIWKRFLASQMSSARIEETDFDIRAGRYRFRAKGEVVQFEGFQVLYAKSGDQAKPKPDVSAQDSKTPLNENDKRLPAARAGETLTLKDLESKQNFTQPPPRYTEGSLVKELEARGIGRPSTYVPIIATLLNRDYVVKEKGKFIPRELGIFVTEYLIKNFPDLMKFEFTAQLEEMLDRISEGGQDWVEYLRSYNVLLDTDLEAAEKIESIKPKGIPSEEVCPECGKPLVIKEGRFGRFKACSGYPECTFKSSLDKKKEARPLDEKCPECGSQLVERRGRYGPFVACSNYPKCRYIKSEKQDTGIRCPDCEEGTIVRKRTRKGKTFYGCSRYPKCKFATWDEPVSRSCPECGRAFLLKKNSVKTRPYIYCGKDTCTYREEITEEENKDGAA